MPLVHAPAVSSVVIAGSGGLGLELYDYLQVEASAGAPNIAGFIDDRPGKVPEGLDVPYLGPIMQYRSAPNQAVLVAIGSPEARQSVLSWLLQNGMMVPSYVHATAIVSPSSSMGVGALIFPFTVVSRGATVEDGVVANVFCGIGHGSRVGACSVLSPYAVLNGDSAIGSRCFLGTRATLYPGVKIGVECTVDSHTGVSSSTNDRQFITSGAYQITSRRIRDA
ncbi:UDP-3-O-(3-hydroxymyristoyl)glucosamine N-acyltransferase [Cupriavidus laharis]|uniref:UDP-3-O-(3-hydroxymyristoyl)glucosamine N-acyltransferase n=1 Tax=Cupriavidus laharis TaxID=151654 RepID=A0ABN7YVH8_9BURK|nr:acetyltransferase [Cupriavidus laharis]CAG9177233.1 UDP-3-O-(3-hydroxymyristoyl)glucosamine N-acyltransferase [Cupriavidus laharis]